MLSKHMQVLIVITKARSDNGFSQCVQKLLPNASNVSRVRAIGEKLDNGTELEPFGLKSLIEATLEIIPEVAKTAFVAAQKVSIEQKVKQSHYAVAKAATASATVGAIPIPFSDAVGLVPIQVTMLAHISAIFGIETTQAFLGTLLATLLGSTAATIGGRMLASGLLKFAPGIGSITSAATAATFTTFIGETYIAALSNLVKNNETGTIKVSQVAEAFKQELGRRSLVSA